jgi:tellurite resistance protein TerC
LETGLAALMIVIGVKMLLADVIHLRPSTSLLLIGLVLGASIGASLVPSRRGRTKAVAPVAVFLTTLP